MATEPAASKEMEIDTVDNDRDVETSAKKIPYPKSVFFILANEFCERFSFYGMKAVLTLYLKNVLKFNEDTSTIIYHAFVFFTYFTPLFGAMIADSFLGKFRTIFYLSIVYALGNITLSLAATPPLHIPGVPFSMLGLALIAMGTGGIKPCVSSFGGDQFVLPQQEAQLSSFFSIFYFSINAGSTISTFLTPILRRDVQCFGDDTCYPLAFLVPASLMITSLIIFLLGRPMYRMRKPTGNVLISLVKAVKHALSRKRKIGKTDPKEHWMDYAEDKYSRREIEDIKIVLRVLFLFIPVPLYWSLYDQQGSRWTFQASRMDGDLGGFVLKPDQLQVINPILVMILIPVFDRVIYPFLAKFNLMKKPLQKMVVGGTFVAISFIVSGIVEIQLEKTYPTELAGGEGHVNFMNMVPYESGLNFALKRVNQTNPQLFHVNPGDNKLFDVLPAGIYSLQLSSNQTGVKPINETFSVLIPSEKALTFVVSQNEAGDVQLTYPQLFGSDSKAELYDTLEKHGEGKPYIRILQVGVWDDPYVGPVPDGEIIELNQNRTIVLDERKKSKNTYEYKYQPNRTLYPDYQSTETLEVEADTYDIFIKTPEGGKGESIGSLKAKLGGSYIIAIISDPNEKSGYRVSWSWVTEPNSVNMLWLVPQYFIISSGEIMFQITIMDFCYSQAPKSMKSVLQSVWLLTVAIGNLIDVIIAALKLFDSQWKEFFLFAGLMLIDLVIFAYMAYKYVPAELQTDEDDETTSLKNNNGVKNEGYDSDKDR